MPVKGIYRMNEVPAVFEFKCIKLFTAKVTILTQRYVMTNDDVKCATYSLSKYCFALFFFFQNGIDLLKMASPST